MIDFEVKTRRINLIYERDTGGSNWVARKLQQNGRVKLSRVFSFRTKDLVGDIRDHLNQEDDDNYARFRFAKRESGYYRIKGRILGIQNDVLLAENEFLFERKSFVAERNINVFGHIAKLRPLGEEIVIGGHRHGNIPTEVFQELLANFPNTSEMDKYARARVETVVGDYFDEMRSARDNYETYMDKQKSTLSDRPLPQVEILQAEINKYIFLRDTISDWLTGEKNRSEHDWQKMIIKIILLIFPKYVAVLENVKIADYYSKPDERTNRFIDLCLVDAVGNIDVIEIKKPFDNGVLGKRKYRDNFIPTRELSGAVMQTEKYIFHLSKWGVDGERQLTKSHQDQLPNEMSVRITNPKGMIIIGRDGPSITQQGFDRDQLFNLEVIKRKYANVIDILTYDDLLRRLNNIIASLTQRKDETI